MFCVCHTTPTQKLLCLHVFRLADLQNFAIYSFTLLSDYSKIRPSVIQHQQNNLVKIFLVGKFLQIGTGKRKFSYIFIAVICLFLNDIFMLTANFA